MVLVLLDTGSQMKSCNWEANTPLRYSSQYVPMIDFKYTVVSLLILIGFAMFTYGSLILVTFSFKYVQMTNEIKRVLWFSNTK